MRCSLTENNTGVLLYYNFPVLQELVFESPKPVIYTSYTYTQNTVTYCATATQEGVYRYTYALNNPLVYTDPSGDFIFTLAAIVTGQWWALPMTIGADLGMWQGGSLANGTMNPLKWDYSSGKTWGYMAGGAVVGGASGYVGGAVATSGMPFANTAALASASFVNSVGTSMYTGGQTDVSINFGFGSYNLDRGEFGYLGKEGNSFMENVGYGLGALTNVSDYVDWKSSYNVSHRDAAAAGNATNQDGWYGKYLGPSGDADPRMRLAGGVSPIDELDTKALFHDIDYFDRGANGIGGALFSKSVMGADLALARGARSLIGNATGLTLSFARGTNIAFSGIYGLKTAMSYSYLYPQMRHR